MKKAMSVFALAGLLTLPAAAGNHQQGVDEIIAKAQKIETEAADLAKHLKLKNPDLTKVNERLSGLDQEAEALQSLVDSFAANVSGLSAEQQQHLDRVMQLAALVNVFVDNKKSMLETGEAAKKRSILQAKADGIARRSEMLQQAASRLRG